jgi:hypothetical protein
MIFCFSSAFLLLLLCWEIMSARALGKGFEKTSRIVKLIPVYCRLMRERSCMACSEEAPSSRIYSYQSTLRLQKKKIILRK